MSLTIHLLVLCGLALVTRQVMRGTVPEPDRDISIALVKLDGNERRYVGENGAVADNQPESGELSSFLPTDDELTADLSDVLPDLSGTSGVAAGQVGANSSAASQPGRDGFGQSGSTVTDIFGIQGTGARFVYVFDRSGSMGGYEGLPMRAAKRELLASLKDLQRQHQFQIVFYDDEVKLFRPLGQPARLVWADEAGKDLARAFVAGIQPDGGTNHYRPLLLALDMQPDVIFFLTDADQPPLRAAQLQTLRRRNSGTTIHAIEFGVGPPKSGGNFLARVASDSGGQYRYINILKMSDE